MSRKNHNYSVPIAMCVDIRATMHSAAKNKVERAIVEALPAILRALRQQVGAIVDVADVTIGAASVDDTDYSATTYVSGRHPRKR